MDEDTFCPDTDLRQQCTNNAVFALESQGDPYTTDDIINEAAKLLEWADNGCMGICGGCLQAMNGND